MEDEIKRPVINHSVLSPSGHISKKARNQAIDKIASELFPTGYWDISVTTPKDEIKALEYQLRDFKELKERGVKPRKLAKEIKKIEDKLKLLNKGE